MALYDSKLENLLWRKRFGGTLKDNVLGMATDSNGDAIVVGGFQGEVQFPNGQTITSTANGTDFFLMKLAH